MSIQDDILKYCKDQKKPLTAKQIVEALYPDKEQPYVNSHINELVADKKLIRDDSSKPYTVAVATVKEVVYQYCKTKKSKLTAKQIVEALYPGKEQPHVNGAINDLVSEGRLTRDDSVSPYVVKAK